MAVQAQESWDDGPRYERYMGRWSRLVAGRFLAWCDVPDGKRWLDVGCGTGVLSQAILEHCAPQQVVGVDRSPGFVQYAAQHTQDARVAFRGGDAAVLPAPSGEFDAVVSGLAFNFFPDADAALADAKRTLAPGGSIALYVWDYAGGMKWLRLFWDAAAAVNPDGLSRDQGERFPLCRPEALHSLFARAGLSSIAVAPIDVDAHFVDFNDYWLPFSAGGPYPAPAYLASRPQSERDAIRDRLAREIPRQADGSIALGMRAWGVKGAR